MKRAVFRGFCPLNALGELDVQRRSTQLLPMLLARGLSLEDAAALSANAVLVQAAAEFDPPLATPQAVLEQLSLAEVAALCEAYHKQKTEPEWDGNESCGEVRA